MPFEPLRGMRKPVVSAVNGICQGGGLLIAMLSDIAVVSERATFRAPELIRGISDMAYAAYLPPLVGVARARDLLLSARTLSAAEAEAWGLITRVVAHETLYEQTVQAVIELGRASPNSRLDVRRALHDWLRPIETGSQMRSLRGPEVQEGFAAFLGRRLPDWALAPDDAPLPDWATG
jgi:enoyl-CoA hydratase